MAEKEAKPTDLKGYLDHLRELTKTRQLVWTRRQNAGPHIFDTRLDGENALSIYYDVVAQRTCLIVVCGEDTINVQNLDVNGDSYKALSKLWDTVATLNLTGVIKQWSKVLPEVDKKIKFGPKDSIA